VSVNDRPDAAQGEDADWAKVRPWLLAHPERVRQDDQLLASLGLWRKANVVDFGPAALGRLEAVAARESDARKAIEQVARANFAAQTQTHGAVVDLLESRNHSDLARRLDTTARERFSLTTATIALETDGGGVPFGWRPLEIGGVDARLGARGLTRLGEWPTDEALFGAIAGEVKSVALARMAPWPQGRTALLAFGSADPQTFRVDMGAELVAFLARVVERTAERWPVL
jgi:uncharacterized protein YigA (DUF484 family)